jgi:hypothetical protein
MKEQCRPLVAMHAAQVGVLDPAAEVGKLEKKVAEISQRLEHLAKRVAVAGYADKTPDAVKVLCPCAWGTCCRVVVTYCLCFIRVHISIRPLIHGTLKVPSSFKGAANLTASCSFIVHFSTSG